MRSVAAVLVLALAGAAVSASWAQPGREASPAPPPAARPGAAPPGAPVVTGPPFAEWLEALQAEARTRGFGEDLLERTLAGLSPLMDVVARDRRQPEVALTFEEYVTRRLTPEVVRRGQELAREHAALLARVEEAYGVPPAVVVAIWGLESRFGQHAGEVPVIQALATLAWEGRRAALFRGQLWDALAMVARGDVEPASLKGSWAGAMGQPQFMPSSYLAYAVDFDGDGRRDIWTSHADTFGSIAHYLARQGWRAGEGWGREVRVEPEAMKRIGAELRGRASGCRAMRDIVGPASAADWQRLGVRRLEGGALPAADPPAGLVQAGARRFLVHANYDAVLRYNCAHHYALTAGLLADRITAEAPAPAPQSRAR
jgi:membrane-bound lytic murein transglycosylase B